MTRSDGWKPSFLGFIATLFAAFAFVRRRRSWLSYTSQSHKLIEIKRAAPFGSHLSKFDLVPAVHSIYLIAFLSNTHRFARDHTMNDLFIFGPWPAPHSAATPINSMPDIVVNVRALFEVEERARISGEHRADVVQCARITDVSNSLAKWP